LSFSFVIKFSEIRSKRAISSRKAAKLILYFFKFLDPQPTGAPATNIFGFLAKLPSFYYMDMWAPLLSCFLYLLRKMEGAGVSLIYSFSVAIQPSTARIGSGFSRLKTFYNKIRILEGAQPLGNGRMVTDFGFFSASKFVGFSLTDNQIREDPADFSYVDRFYYTSSTSENFMELIGDLWNVFVFFRSGFRVNPTKSFNGPLVCGTLGVKQCPLDMSQKHTKATISIILEGGLLKTHRERQLFPISLSDSVFGEFSPLNLQFLQNEDSDLPRR